MNSHSLFYILNAAGEPVPANPVEWSVWFRQADKRLALTEVGETAVSTAFLGMDHNHGVGLTAVLWETRVSGGPMHGTVKRYESKALALVGHDMVVGRVREEQGEE